MIEARSLTKRYGGKLAVSNLTFTIRPGVVTGFLGPNGAGKSTTMRLIVGLDAPTDGRVTVNGRRYAEHPAPLREVGLLLEAQSIHPGRTARDHLLAIGQTHGISRRRVDELIGLVGLQPVARTPAGRFSLGMSQRLGIATALLGDPATLILDEPVNGLDPEGVRWVRGLLRQLAAEGRTVLLSSHLMSEMALTADHLIVLGRGRVIADAGLPEFVRRHARAGVRVRSSRARELAEVLRGPEVRLERAGDGLIEVEGLSAEQVGEAAAAHGLPVHELARDEVSLEDAYMELTGEEVEYRATADAESLATNGVLTA